MRTCKLFDKYRDKELSPEERKQFEMHLADCVDCQTKRFLINNVAFVIRQEEAIAPPDLSRRIAFRAFSQKKTWDSLVVSWLRPGPALATLTLALALFSFLWIFAGSRTTAVNDSEYEALINDADSLSLTVNASQVRADNDLWLWLEQERNYQ